MSNEKAIADYWATGDVYARIVDAFAQAAKPLDTLTVQDLALVDHVHGRGLSATVELGDHLPIQANHHLLDVGCGLGGPARYLAHRFDCKVSGIDITKPFVEAANQFTRLLGMQDQVTIEHGNGYHLPYVDEVFDGAYTQHVTMNVSDRGRFFAEVYRVLKPGAFFALTEHGLGFLGQPHYPLPWSEDGRGSYLVSPAETRTFLQATGFVDIVVEDTGAKYLAAYQQAPQEGLPLLGAHILIGETARQKTLNAARNIEEGRTKPVQVVCRKPA